MKNLLFILGFITFPLLAGAQTTTKLLDKPDTTKKVLIVEASCGQCKFGLPGMGCSLAVRIDGQAYYVNGTNIDSHGD